MAAPGPLAANPGARPAAARRRAPRGFSLVESAVVLVIVALALAAVLQGRQLIAGAEYKALRRQLAEQRDAFHAFRARYHALPGDFAAARARLGVAPGNGDGIIGAGAACAVAGDESCRAWQQLRAAGLLAGDPRATGLDARPKHAYGGVVAGFFTGEAGNGRFGHKLAVAGLPLAVASRLDRDADDGRCDGGRIAALDADLCDGSGWPPAPGTVDIVRAP